MAGSAVLADKAGFNGWQGLGLAGTGLTGCAPGHQAGQ